MFTGRSTPTSDVPRTGLEPITFASYGLTYSRELQSSYNDALPIELTGLTSLARGYGLAVTNRLRRPASGVPGAVLDRLARRRLGVAPTVDPTLRAVLHGVSKFTGSRRAVQVIIATHVISVLRFSRPSRVLLTVAHALGKDVVPATAARHVVLVTPTVQPDALATHEVGAHHVQRVQMRTARDPLTKIDHLCV